MARGAGHGTLLGWLDGASGTRGIRVADDEDGWGFTSYSALASVVRRAAGELGQEGVRPGDVVGIAVPAADEFAVAFFGVLAAGAVPAPLPLPLSLSDLDTYLELAVAMLRVASPRLLLAPPALVGLVTGALRASDLDVRPHTLSLTADEMEPAPRPGSTPGLLQFTSGSSGRPRAVRVTWDNIEANCRAIGRWLGMSDQRVTASWLPLYHDMGLIGCLVASVLHGSDLWSMRPDQFIRSPLRWLDCFGRRGGEFTASPNFGLAYVLRRVAPADLAGMDFSNWRAAVIGSERVEPATLRRFASLLAPFGFCEEVLRPAYGLAEATLAVTGGAGGRIRVVKPRWSELATGRPVAVDADTTLVDPALEGAGWVVSCGSPLAGIEVEVVDDHLNVLGEGVTGELVVRGPSVAAGYLGEDSLRATFLERDRLRTGDAGFLLDGEVFIIGRLGDGVKMRGRHLYAEDLEGKVAAACGLATNRIAVLLGSMPGVNVVGLVLEVESAPSGVSDAIDLLRREAGADSEIRVRLAPRGTILRTTSGKVRRRELWASLLGGHLAGERLVVPATPSDAGQAAHPTGPDVPRVGTSEG